MGRGLCDLGPVLVPEELVEVGSGDSEGAADLDAGESCLAAGSSPLAGGCVGGVALILRSAAASSMVRTSVVVRSIADMRSLQGRTRGLPLLVS